MTIRPKKRSSLTHLAYAAIPHAACKFFMTSAGLPWQQAKGLLCSFVCSSETSFVSEIGSMFSASLAGSSAPDSTVDTSPSSSMGSGLSAKAAATRSTFTASSGITSCEEKNGSISDDSINGYIVALTVKTV